MGESLEVASCGCRCSWGGEGPLGWLSHEVPPWFSEAAPPHRAELPRPGDPRRGTATASWEPLVPLCPPNCSFLFHRFSQIIVCLMWPLASVPRPSPGGWPRFPCPAFVNPMVHITAPLSPVGTPTAWARVGGEGPPPRPPCPRWILRHGPQISAQPFVMTGQSLLPTELSAVGLISAPCRAGAGAPGPSWGGSRARPGVFHRPDHTAGLPLPVPGS